MLGSKENLLDIITEEISDLTDKIDSSDDAKAVVDWEDEVNELKRIHASVNAEQYLNFDDYMWLCDLVDSNAHSQLVSKLTDSISR